jgi:methionyl-tRNA synthetase
MLLLFTLRSYHLALNDFIYLKYRFHAIYLPSILLALSLPLPQSILAHGHWTMDKFKMSKSRGNVVDPFELMNTWGRDAVRCWLMRVGGNPGNDAGKFKSSH